MSAEPIIEAEGLTDHYGERIAVDHIDFRSNKIAGRMISIMQGGGRCRIE